jgi:hypothetical protein
VTYGVSLGFEVEKAQKWLTAMAMKRAAEEVQRQTAKAN